MFPGVPLAPRTATDLGLKNKSIMVHRPFYRVFINYKSIDCRPIRLLLSGSQPMRSLCGRKNDACVHNHGAVLVGEYRVHIDFGDSRRLVHEMPGGEKEDATHK